ncbi:MAG TPA: ArsA family ATPase [Solirubrobacteraceae bacterium]|nr:ArsA family ATPase [Solirubrobacteraceae bacterium]
MRQLLDRRLIFVTGKGGVGKSTVATALGLVAARRGLRTIVAELASQSRVAGSFRRPSEPFAETEVADGLYAISIDPQLAMEEYLRVKTGALGQMLGSSRLFGALAMATPGMRELLSIGKVWELAQLERRTRGADAYDLVIVDSPAAGHGVGLLRTPRSFAEMARVGPIAHQAQTIARTISDQDFTAVVAVTTAEEMPVNETLWLAGELERQGLTLEETIVNALYPERFTAAEARELAVLRGRTRRAAQLEALDVALWHHGRAGAQRAQLARLREGIPRAPLELPFLFCERVGSQELVTLADALELGLAPAAAGDPPQTTGSAAKAEP